MSAAIIAATAAVVAAGAANRHSSGQEALGPSLFLVGGFAAFFVYVWFLGAKDRRENRERKKAARREEIRRNKRLRLIESYYGKGFKDRKTIDDEHFCLTCFDDLIGVRSCAACDGVSNAYGVSRGTFRATAASPDAVVIGPDAVRPSFDEVLAKEMSNPPLCEVCGGSGSLGPYHDCHACDGIDRSKK